MPSGPGVSQSGWDIKEIRFAYDDSTDSLLVGMNFFFIASDADGDGDPSGSSSGLTTRGGVDAANLGVGETILIHFDWDGDADFETIAGVADDVTAPGFAIAPDLQPTLSLGAALTSARFGTPMAGFPSWAAPRAPPILSSAFRMSLRFPGSTRKRASVSRASPAAGQMTESAKTS